MSWAATAIAGGTIVSGYMSSQAAGDQVDAAKDATQASVAEQRRQFDLIRGDTEPYREIGQNALYEMSNMLGMGNRQYQERTNRLSNLRDQLSETDKFITTGGEIKTRELSMDEALTPGEQARKNMRRRYHLNPPTEQYFAGEETKLNDEYTRLEDEISSLQAEIEQTGGGPGEGGGFDVSQIPGYEFRMEQGTNALNNSLAASGNRFSGRAMKAAQRYGQGLASQEYGQHFNRLAGLAGTGQSAVGTSGQAGMQTASGVSNALMQGGIAAGQAQAQGAANINNSIQGGIGNYLSYRQNQQLLNQMGG